MSRMCGRSGPFAATSSCIWAAARSTGMGPVPGTSPGIPLRPDRPWGKRGLAYGRAPAWRIARERRGPSPTHTSDGTHPFGELLMELRQGFGHMYDDVLRSDLSILDLTGNDSELDRCEEGRAGPRRRLIRKAIGCVAHEGRLLVLCTKAPNSGSPRFACRPAPSATARGPRQPTSERDCREDRPSRAHHERPGVERCDIWPSVPGVHLRYLSQLSLPGAGLADQGGAVEDHPSVGVASQCWTCR